MTFTHADEKVIQRIKDGAHKVYPEQIYVEPAIVPGAFVTFFCGMFLAMSIMFPDSPDFFLFDWALFGTITGIIILIPGIFVWYYLRSVYSYLGLWRDKVALSITALELTNLCSKDAKVIISPLYPHEYESLSLFVSIGPSTLLKKMEEVQWDPELLARMVRQKESFTNSINALVGAISLQGGLICLGLTALLSLLQGTLQTSFLLLSLFLLFFAVALLLQARHKLRAIDDEETKMSDPSTLPDKAQTLSTACSIEEILSLVRMGYTHPMRVLVVETFSDLEYTGRVYYTGDGLELQEAYLLPAVSTSRGDL